MSQAVQAEQVLVRRVVTVVCVLAMLTVPLVHWGLGAFASWISVAHLGALTLAFAMLGRGRVSLAGVVAVAGIVLLTITLVGMGLIAAATFDGTRPGVGLGTGLLWLTAGLAPIVALAVSLRRAVALGFVVVGLAVLAVVGAADWQWDEVARHPGVLQVLTDVGIVLLTTVVVAWLARRSADDRHLADERQRVAASRVARLEAAQRQRAEVFTHTAARLRVPMDELVEETAALHAGAAELLVERSARIEALAGSMHDAVVAELDALVERLRAGVGGTGAAGRSDAPVTTPVSAPADLGRSLVGSVVLVGVMALVVGDAWRTIGLVEGGLGDAHVVAAATNRMVTVLFVAVAVVVVRLPGRRGWIAAGAMLLLHPVTVVLLLAAEARTAMFAPYLAAWRMSLIATATLALLAAIIARRVDERERLDRATAAATTLADLQAQQEELVQRTYAEAAHELKNPLTVIGGAAGTIRQHTARLSPDQLARLSTSLRRAVDRLDRRLSAMHGVAEEPTAAGRGLTREPVLVPPAPAAGIVRQAVASALDGVHPMPVLDLAELRGTTRVAPGALQHVIENLVGNAIKHGDPTSVRVAARGDGGEVLLTVMNQGGSLTEDEVLRVFEPYFRAGGTDADVEGSGLGLAIVARLVQSWGGRCWAAVEGGWTTVGVSLPTVVDDEVATPLRGQPV